MNVGAIIAGHAISQPGKVAIESRDGVVTYGEFDRLVRGFAIRLQQLGVVPGDPVAVRMGDNMRHVAALAAVLRIGAIVLPIDWRAAPVEVENAVVRFHPRVLLSDGPLPPMPAPVVDAATIAASDAEVPPAELVGATMAYAMTSGTTGAPKLFRLTHEAFHARVMQFRESGLILPGDRLIGPIPLAYSAGREMGLGLLLQGATFILLPPMTNVAEIVRSANERDASVVLVSPNVTRTLLDLAGDGRHRLMPKLRMYINATAKADPEERARARARLAPHVADMYGTTGGGLVSIIHDEDVDADPTSVGTAGPGITVEIVDDEHKSVAVGTPGRIRLQGPGVVREFVGDVAFGEEGIRDGWYYPGDIGAFDADGNLHLLDRSADLIKRGGLMIHAQEVERVLRSHPAVADAVVFGVPSPTLGNEVAAVVSRRGPVNTRELTDFCRTRLAGYKVPTQLRFVNELPRNANGKVVKAELPRLWDAAAD